MINKKQTIYKNYQHLPTTLLVGVTCDAPRRNATRRNDAMSPCAAVTPRRRRLPRCFHRQTLILRVLGHSSLSKPIRAQRYNNSNFPCVPIFKCLSAEICPKSWKCIATHFECLPTVLNFVAEISSLFAS